MQRALLVCLLLAVCAGCAGFRRWPWGSTQRWPGPMRAANNPLGQGDIDSYPLGPEEVLVVRHADPVQVRPAGFASAYPLTFYNKSTRVHSGSGVFSAPGGRIEVIWPSGSSVVLFGNGAGIVGSPSRGEASFIFRQVERAALKFNTEEQVELLGGARMTLKSGPFILDHIGPDILRVKNQSKASGLVSFREEVFTLDPGQIIDLALLSAGSSPLVTDPDRKQLQGPGFLVQHDAQAEVSKSDDAVVVRATSEQEVQALGLRLKLASGEQVSLRGLGAPQTSPAAGVPGSGAPK